MVKIFIQLSILTMMLDVGLQLSVQQIVDSVKRWKSLLVGVVQNVAVVPLVAYLILTGTADYVSISAGVFAALALTGVSPGPPIGPKMVAVAKGDLAYASVLMLACQLVSIFTAPIWARTILADSTSSDVSVVGVILTLIGMLLVPLAIGMAIHSKFGWKADPLGKIAQASTGLLFLATFIVLVVETPETFTGISLFEYGFMLAVTAVFAGVAVFSPVVNKEERLSLVVMSGSRNFALAMVLAAKGFGGEAALSGTLVLGAMSTSVGFLIVGFIGARRSKAARLAS